MTQQNHAGDEDIIYMEREIVLPESSKRILTRRNESQQPAGTVKSGRQNSRGESSGVSNGEMAYLPEANVVFMDELRLLSDRSKSSSSRPHHETTNSRGNTQTGLERKFSIPLARVPHPPPHRVASPSLRTTSPDFILQHSQV